MGIKNYKKCQKLCLNYGDFMNVSTTTARNGPINVSKHHSITQLEFRYSDLSKNTDILLGISSHYPYLKTLEFHNWDFGNKWLPVSTVIALPGTAIDTLSLYESYSGWMGSVEDGLVNDMANSDTNVFISGVSGNQNFSKGYIITNCSNGSMVEETSYETLDAIKKTVDVELASFVTIKVKHISKLKLKFEKECLNNEVYFDASISFP